MASSRFTLTRVAYTGMGTFGELVVGDRRFFTVERPWRDNEPYVSCIPEGDYKVMTLPTTTPVPLEFKGETWYLHGGTVGVDVGERTRIAIHIANTMDDVQGCIGVGMRLACVKGKWAVADSLTALQQLKQLLPEDFNLSIVWGTGT